MEQSYFESNKLSSATGKRLKETRVERERAIILTPRAEAASVISPVPPRLHVTATNQYAGCPVVRCPAQLQLHRGLAEIGWMGATDDFSHAVRFKNESLPEPVLVTKSGTILAGFARWRLALLEGKQQVHCIEYPLDEDESLAFILSHHQSRRGWHAFIRIRLALTQELSLQRRALQNMREGGKYKGSANLPNLERIDVRHKIGTMAGVGARNISNVKAILQVAHPRIIEALIEGTLTIYRAAQLCKSPPDSQLEEFIRYCTERATGKVIRQSLSKSRKQNSNRADVVDVLDVLRQQELKQPGSVTMQVSKDGQSIVVIGGNVLSQLIFQKELNLR